MNNTIKFKLATLVFSLTFVLSSGMASAQTVTVETTLKPKQTIRKEIQEDRKEIRQEKNDLKNDLKGAHARLVKAQVTAISGSTLTVTLSGKTYTVNTASATFRRRFWGGSSISEISVKDLINVWGKFTDDAKTIIDARLIRDVSIQKRNGVFVGTISSKSDSSFILASKNRGNQTVTISTSTKVVDKRGTTTSLTAMNVSDKVRVRGVWDRANNTITEVKEVKDFSLPK